MSSLGGTDIALFDVAEQKLQWLDARQSQLSQNIANADTPGYRARDVKPFASALDQFTITPARTSPLHLAAYSIDLPGTVEATAERAPDGNDVALEDELTKVAQDDTSQALVGNLWTSYMGMFMTALGKGS
jgi:flagellar basal-body rod protein FlgB